MMYRCGWATKPGQEHTVHDIRGLLKAGDHQAAAAHLPAEHVYPLSDELRPRIDASPPA
jgi:hypothetical protein